MAERVPNEIKLVAWFMQKKAVIKFANDDTTYKLAEAVIKASNFEKFPLSKGDKVEVGIKEGVVTFLRKQKSDAPKAESHGSEEAYEPTPEEEAGPAPKVEAPAPKAEPVAPPPVAESGVKELTVFAVAANKKVVKFLECKEAGWFQIAEAIQTQDYKVIGLEAKKKANVLITENTVMSFQKVASEPAEQPKTATSSQADVQSERIATPSTTSAPVQAPKKEWKPYSSQDNDGRQKSIECQASINSACQVVGMMAANIEPKPTANVLNSMIKAVAESNYQLLQELKKK
jgi:hypothetical protein